MEMSYREIIKAKAEALAQFAAFGDEIAIRAAMADLVSFNRHVKDTDSLAREFDESPSR